MTKRKITRIFLIFLIVILSVVSYVHALDGDVGGGIGIDITVVQNADELPQNQTNVEADLGDRKNSNKKEKTNDNSDDIGMIDLNFEDEKEQEIVIQRLNSVEDRDSNFSFVLFGMTGLLILILIFLVLFFDRDFIGKN